MPLSCSSPRVAQTCYPRSAAFRQIASKDKLQWVLTPDLSSTLNLRFGLETTYPMPAIATTETSRTIITAESGTYALILFCSRAERVRIGKLGPLKLRRGFYVYVGSALGPGGVRARVAHHQKVSPRPHWHVDYLRFHTRLDGIWYSHDQVRREHQWARLIHTLRGASVPAAGFGSSDCRCETHLFFFKRRPSFHEFQQGAGGPRRLVKALLDFSFVSGGSGAGRYQVS
jgi:Uri superfamily endonuclease